MKLEGSKKIKLWLWC